MRSRLMSLLTVIGAVTVLALAANTVALATTGKALIAGTTNTSSKITTLSRTTSGVPLKIASKSTANAPLAVNGKGKVVNLNADRVDGLTSSSLQTRVRSYTLPDFYGAQFSLALPDLAPGVYFANYTLRAIGSDVVCFFSYAKTGYGLMSYGNQKASTGIVNGSGIIDTRGGNTATFNCYSSEDFELSGNIDPKAQLNFMTVDSRTSAAAVLE